eukprot:XP_024307841.1 myomegalin-like isoform X1 [Homo sapiens]
MVLGSKGIHELRSSTSALHHALEESASLLTMFWRVALPSTHIPVLPGKVGESTERELLELRTKVSKQERLLQSTAEHLKNANQQKESMEQFIVSQLTRTHDVLKKARTNLEVRKLLHQSEAPSLSPTHHHPLADIVGNPWPALAFQEKISSPLARSQVLSELPDSFCSHHPPTPSAPAPVSWFTLTL